MFPPALKLVISRSLLVALNVALPALVPDEMLPVFNVPPAASVTTEVAMLEIAVWACAAR